MKDKLLNSEFYAQAKTFLIKLKERDFDFELNNRHLMYICTLIIGIFLADQITKFLADSVMMEGQNYEVIDGFFYFTYVHNKGMAWSMLEGRRWFFLLMTPLVLCALVYFFASTKKHEVLTRFGVILVIAGALGNYADRLFLGYVRDFIHFYIFDYDFPIFNVADIAVCIGVGLIILEIIIQEYQIWKLSKSL